MPQYEHVRDIGCRYPNYPKYEWGDKMVIDNRKHEYLSAQRLSIQIRLPEGHWAGDLTRQLPHVVLRIEEHMPLSKGMGTAKTIINGPNMDQCLDLLDKHEGIDEVSIYSANDTMLDLNLTIKRGGGGFLRALSKATVVPKTPFEVRDGWVEWEFSTDQEHARTLIGALKTGDIPHRILSFGHEQPSRLLTPRQREVFDLAVQEGYYDSPRRITLTSLAEKLSVSKSTVCELIHIIEHRIVNEFSDSIRRRSPSE